MPASVTSSYCRNKYGLFWLNDINQFVFIMDIDFVPCNLGIKFLRQLENVFVQKLLSNCMKHTTATQLLLYGIVLRSTLTIKKNSSTSK